MVWFLVALILGSHGFACATIMKYKESLDDLQPRLRDLQGRGEKLDVLFKKESGFLSQDEEKRTTIRALIDQKKIALTDLKRLVQEAEKAQESLEMDLQMNEFKKYK